MTKEKAQRLWPLLQAWCEGKQLQIRDYEGHWCDSDFDYTEFSCDFSVYRIKPTLKLRPWKPEEVPFNCWLKTRNDNSKSYWKPITINEEGVGTVTNHPNEECLVGRLNSFKYLYETCDYSIDHGKTWHPCGVLEDQP